MGFTVVNMLTSMLLALQDFAQRLLFFLNKTCVLRAFYLLNSFFKNMWCFDILESKMRRDENKIRSGTVEVKNQKQICIATQN